MTRLVRGLLVVALLLVACPDPAASAPAVERVTWKVDHKAKTITVTARLFLYPAGDWPEGQGINPSIVAWIRHDVLRIWNRDYRYHCYKLVFEMDVAFDNDGNRFTVPRDRVGVALERDDVPIRSHVMALPGITTPWNSNDPSAKLSPINSYVNPTAWSYPPPNWDTTYAHEFGHILGLDESQEWWSGDPKPGAPKDLMSTAGTWRIHQSTIDRLVQRSGAVKDSELQCGYKVSYDQGINHFRGVKCGGPVGTWTIEQTVDLPNTVKVTSKIIWEIGPDLKGTSHNEYAADSYLPRARAHTGGNREAEVRFDFGPPPSVTVTGAGGTIKFPLETEPAECKGK